MNKKFRESDILLYILVFVFVAIFNEYILNLGGELFDIDYGIEYVENGYLMVAIVAATTILSFIFYKRLISINKSNAPLVELNAISMGLWILRLFSRTAERMTLYFMPFTILLICQLLKLVRRESDKVIFSVGVFGLAAFLFVYRLNTLGLLPYLFFWN